MNRVAIFRDFKHVCKPGGFCFAGVQRARQERCRECYDEVCVMLSMYDCLCVCLCTMCASCADGH